MTDKEFTDIAAELRRLAISTTLALWNKGETGRAYIGDGEAEDVAQDTMLRLWRLHYDIRMPDDARHLSVTIAKNLAIDRLRKRRSVPIDDVLDKAVDSESKKPDVTFEDQQNELWLQKHLKNLPPNEYLVLHLRQVEQKSKEEIAAILGIKPASVPVLLSRARHKLLESLKRGKLI